MNTNTHKRSMFKAVIYRAGGIIALATITWIITRNIIQVSTVTIIYHAISIIGYYAYERCWEHIKWGKSTEE